MKLENGSGYFLIDEVPYPKAEYSYVSKGDKVTIYEVGADFISIATGIFSEFTDSNDVPYGSVTALKADLDNILFQV